MFFDIKELRESTGMTQKTFAGTYGIPISTLRKWEQRESSPAPYVANLLARALPENDKAFQKIAEKDGTFYYYDEMRKLVSDMRGNKIYIEEDLNGVKKQNLALYLKELFQDFYTIQAKFNSDCRYDKKEDILWN